jgi:hypothetical protein
MFHSITQQVPTYFFQFFLTSQEGKIQTPRL